MHGVLSSVFWGILTLSILVFVHEAGHFLAARAFNIRVTEFFLGMPSRYKWSYTSKKRGTEIGVTPVLLGGYTRVCGMEGELSDSMADTLYYVTTHGRASVDDIAQALHKDEEEIFNNLVVLTDWASIEAFYDPEKGESPDDKNWPRVFQTVNRDENLLTNFDKEHSVFVHKESEPLDLNLSADEFYENEKSHTYVGKGFWNRFTVLFCGPLVNFIVGIVLIVTVLSGMGVDIPVNTNVIGGVQEGSVASQAGIKADDTILSVAGVETNDFEQIVKAAKEAINSGENFEVVGKHASGDEYTSVVDIKNKDVEYIGVSAKLEKVKMPIGKSFTYSFKYVEQVVKFATKLLVPTQAKQVLDSSSSVVGISVMASKAASQGLSDIMMFCASISMSLAVMNLLPIPPLDGGKIFIRSEERRVGKECRSRWSPYH